MTDQVPPGEEGTGYEVRIEGHLDGHWSAWFADMTLQHESDGTTTLRGVVTDQAELHGLLAKVRDLGATLISLDRRSVGRTARSRPRKGEATLQRRKAASDLPFRWSG